SPPPLSCCWEIWAVNPPPRPATRAPAGWIAGRMRYAPTGWRSSARLPPHEGAINVTTPPIKRVHVTGVGVMGAAIAQVLALHGCAVRLHDVSDERLAWA